MVVDTLTAILVAGVLVCVLGFIHVQLLDRRKKRHSRWKREHKAKEKRIEETFAEPEPTDAGGGESDESGESDSDDLPRVKVEPEPVPNVVGGNAIHAPDESCRMCGRSDYSDEMVEIGDMVVCPRQSCFKEAARVARSNAAEVLRE